MTSPSNDNSGNTISVASCPLCNKPAAPEYAPFCSKRCADVDLHRWLSGSYAIPSQDDESDGKPPGSDEA